MIKAIAPGAEVIRYAWGYTVYGWTHASDNGRRVTRMRIFVSNHIFRWRANRARDRWLKEQGER